MPEATQFIYKHKELAALMIKAQDIHDGFWGIFVKFGIGAMNMGQGPADLLPTAIVPVIEIGLRKYEEETNLSVNAAEVNPLKAKGTKKKANHKTLAK